MNVVIQCLQFLLRDILSAYPAGLSEYDLLKMLAAYNVSLFNDDYINDPYGLFQRHFLLFHCLHLLRNELRAAQQADLNIHCMDIRLISYSTTPSVHPAVPEPLAAYYLDLDNLKSTDESDVLRMLDDFWNKFAGAEHRDEALAVMELNHPTSYPEIQRQYRCLAMVHHPDRGGEPAQFRRLEWAMGILRMLYQ